MLPPPSSFPQRRLLFLIHELRIEVVWYTTAENPIQWIKEMNSTQLWFRIEMIQFRYFRRLRFHVKLRVLFEESCVNYSSEGAFFPIIELHLFMLISFCPYLNMKLEDETQSLKQNIFHFG